MKVMALSIYPRGFIRFTAMMNHISHLSYLDLLAEPEASFRDSRTIAITFKHTIIALALTHLSVCCVITLFQ